MNLEETILLARPNKSLIHSRVKVAHNFVPQIVVNVVAISFAKLGARVPFESYLKGISILAPCSGGSQSIGVPMRQRIHNIEPGRAVAIDDFEYADHVFPKEEGGGKLGQSVILLLVALVQHIYKGTNVLGIQYVATADTNKFVLFQHLAIHEVIMDVRWDDEGSVAQT